MDQSLETVDGSVEFVGETLVEEGGHFMSHALSFQLFVDGGVDENAKDL